MRCFEPPGEKLEFEEARPGLSQYAFCYSEEMYSDFGALLFEGGKTLARKVQRWSDEKKFERDEKKYEREADELRQEGVTGNDPGLLDITLPEPNPKYIR